MSDAFYEDGSRMLTPPAFGFVFAGELRRAVRSRTYVTLVVLEVAREWEGLSVSADDGTLAEMAQVLARDLRETDPLGRTDVGVLSLLLPDADLEQAGVVVERLVGRLDEYAFPSRLRLSAGAACFPMQAADQAALRQRAVSHPLASWRGGDAPTLPPHSRT